LKLNRNKVQKGERELKIGKSSLMRVVETALEAVESLVTQERQGGYLAIIRHTDGSVLLHCQIGNVLPEKKEKYRAFALEKAERARRTKKPSWVTRNLAKERYGGGIHAEEYDLGFSGFTELNDEKVVTQIAKEIGLITESDVKAIFAISGNTLAS
jgi:hypothetical protein